MVDWYLSLGIKKIQKKQTPKTPQTNKQETMEETTTKYSPY